MHRGGQIWENMTLPEFFQLNDVYSAYGSSQNGSGFVPQQRRLEMEQSQGLKKKSQNDARSCSSSSEVRSVSNNGVKNDVQELQELLSKLNPLAEEFVPPSLSRSASSAGFSLLSDDFGREMFFGGAYSDNCDEMPGNLQFRKKKNAFQGRRRSNNRTTLAQQEDSIRRTVYVSDIDQQVTEEQLAALFVTCGQVVDCRICGDPNSVLRFAFVEFTDEEGAKAALSLAGTVLGYYPVRVLPSKTAIAPVNPTFLPRSENEREMCARTVYCTNIDKKVSQTDVKLFFESLCGKVSRLRLLGDYHHFTRIAFVEFVMADSATAALNCSGAVLGSLPIRVSPSKTPVRPRNPRSIMHLKQLTDV